jgi:folate-binding Fe-S cluster repair protein YgfZ
MVPAISIQGYDAARQRAGLVDRAEYSYIVLSGKDRASYLQGLSPTILPLQARPRLLCRLSHGARGMIADLWVYELGDVMLLRMLGDVKPTVLAGRSAHLL